MQFTHFRRSRFAVLALLLAVATAMTACQRKPAAPSDGSPPPAATKAWSGAKHGPADAAARPVPVGLGVLTTEDLPVSITALGTVTPVATVTVKPRVDGQIVRLNFTEGQAVHAGDLLAEIDPRPFNVQYDQAAGQLSRDRALLETAKLDLSRYRLLFSQDSIAKQQVDSQESLVRQYQGSIKTDEANVASARLQQAYAKVTAPVSGRVGLRQVDLGNVVHAADATGLVVITQLKPITVVGTVPEDRLPALMKRLLAHEPIPVEAYDRTNANRLASGVLLTVDNQIDVATGTVKVKAQFANDDLSLFPNQFVNLKVQYGSLSNVTVAPTSAVQQGPDGSFIYTVGEDSTVHLSAVKVLSTVRERTAIDTPLAPGTPVVVDGIDRLREGAKVRGVAPSSGNPAGSSDPRKKKPK